MDISTDVPTDAPTDARTDVDKDVLSDSTVILLCVFTFGWHPPTDKRELLQITIEPS